jgi:glycosyltransferase involved in cell wall biosynthesis
MRSVFWSHVSGLFRPVIAPAFFEAADRFVFTTPASMVLGEGLPEHRKSRLSSIGSGFGFPDLPPLPGSPPSALPGISPSGGEIDSRQALAPISKAAVERGERSQPISPLEVEMSGRTEGGKRSLENIGDHPITYLGTVDFMKMHPGFFDAADALSHHADVAIWGGCDPDGEVAARAASMRHPGRIHFMGQTSDPQAALEKSRIFFYPLQPDHYGTAENALIEAMSLGLVPVVLANPAECAIVEHGVTGLVAESIDECTGILDRLLDSPEEITRLGVNAAKTAREKFTPGRSASAFVALWQSLLPEPKRTHEFASVAGQTPLDWYLATQFLPEAEIARSDESAKQSKGTLAHFRSTFPDDPCWKSL